MMQICDFLTLRDVESWPLIRQIGVDHAVAKLSPELTGVGVIADRDTFVRLLRTYRSHGFEVVALEGDQFDMTRIKEGLPGRDEDLDQYARMLQNMGELDVPLLCYNFMARTGWYRNRHDLKERGSALVSGFSLHEEKAFPEEELLAKEEIRENYRYFLNAVLPVAQAAGVVMALHPDDPPQPLLHGVGRIAASIEDIEWAMGLSSSSSHRLTFCQANYRLMNPEGLLENIRRFGSEGKIAYAHWRDVIGDVDEFRETFHDNGPTDMVATLRAYRDVGVDVPIRVDHVPALHGEQSATGYTMLGRLHAIGYLHGILEALEC